MTRAIVIMFIAMSFIPAGDTASKILTTQYGVSPAYVVWTRFVIGALILLPFTWRAGLAVWRDWRVWFRAVLLAGGITSITIALSQAPLADVFGAFFVGPMVSFVLSVILLKEQARPVQAVLVVLGFFGVLMILRPGFEWRPGLEWAVLAGCFYGGFLTASRWLSGTVPLGGLMLSQMLLPAMLATSFAVPNLPDLTPQVLGLTLASSVCSMAGNVLLLFAYKMQDASKLAPFVYIQLIAATGLGWLIFGALPDAWTVMGIAVIIAAGSASAALTGRPVSGSTQR